MTKIALDVANATTSVAAGGPIRRRVPRLEDDNRVDGDEVIALLKSSGYWGREMDEKLAPVLTDVTRTFRAAYGRRSGVFTSVVAREEGALIGHASSLRTYDRTWMTQHLATSPSWHVADLLCIRAGDHLLQTTNVEFFKIWYQDHNTWPARVFGGFAHGVAGSARSDLRGYRHVTIATGGARVGLSTDIDVREATADDLARVAGYFADSEAPILVRSDGLDRAGLALDDVRRAFRDAGLVRCRQILAATRRGVCVGFAIPELSSVGLNLYEILSAFRIFILPGGEGDEPAVRSVLSDEVRRLYAAAGRATAHGLASPGEVSGYQRLGFEIDSETWMCWTFDREVYQGFRAHLERLFDRLRRARVPSSQ